MIKIQNLKSIEGSQLYLPLDQALYSKLIEMINGTKNEIDKEANKII